MLYCFTTNLPLNPIPMHTRWKPHSFACLILLPLLVSQAHSRFVNRTIDDQWGDESNREALPLYYPPSTWEQGAICAGCGARLDHSKVWMGTWHDTTLHPPTSANQVTVTMTFNGTAIYVYNVLANFAAGKLRSTALEFHLDGVLSGNFTHIATDSPDYEYDVIVYSKTGLESSFHTLEMRAVAESFPSLVLFDRAVYTVTVEDDDPTLPSSSPNPSPTLAAAGTTSNSRSSLVAAVAGSTIGGVVLVAVLGALLWFRHKRRRHRRLVQDSIGDTKAAETDSLAYRSDSHRGGGPSDSGRDGPVDSAHDSSARHVPRLPPFYANSARHGDEDTLLFERRMQGPSVTTSGGPLTDAGVANCACSGCQTRDSHGAEMAAILAELARIRQAQEIQGLVVAEAPPAYPSPQPEVQNHDGDMSVDSVKRHFV